MDHVETLAHQYTKLSPIILISGGEHRRLLLLLVFFHQLPSPPRGLHLQNLGPTAAHRTSTWRKVRFRVWPGWRRCGSTASSRELDLRRGPRQRIATGRKIYARGLRTGMALGLVPQVCEKGQRDHAPGTQSPRSLASPPFRTSPDRLVIGRRALCRSAPPPPRSSQNRNPQLDIDMMVLTTPPASLPPAHTQAMTAAGDDAALALVVLAQSEE